MAEGTICAMNHLNVRLTTNSFSRFCIMMLAGAVPLGAAHLVAQDGIRNNSSWPIISTRPILPGYAAVPMGNCDVVWISAGDASARIGNQPSGAGSVEFIPTVPAEEANGNPIRPCLLAVALTQRFTCLPRKQTATRFVRPSFRDPPPR